VSERPHVGVLTSETVTDDGIGDRDGVGDRDGSGDRDVAWAGQTLGSDGTGRGFAVGCTRTVGSTVGSRESNRLAEPLIRNFV
jgi:hypothetical protein